MDPRGKAEARKAEADLETEAGKAEVNLMIDPWIDDPRKGQNLMDARRRRTWRLLSSELETKREWAEPECRRKTNREVRTPQVMVQLQVL